MTTPTWSETNQRDTRWSDKKLGFALGGETIGTHGSLLVCFAILAGTEPCRMNKRRMEQGGYGPPAQANWKAVTFALDAEARGFGREVRVGYNSARYCTIPFPETDEARLMEHLLAGQPAIIEVDCVPDDGPAEAHFVLGVGVAEDGTHIQIIDPWTGRRGDLLPEYGCRNNRAIVRAILYEVNDGIDSRSVGPHDCQTLRACAGRNRYERE